MPFVFSESREQSTYCKHCMMATIKVNACYTVKSYKNKLKKKISNRGARARRAGAGSAFGKDSRIIYTCIKCNQRLLHEFKSSVIFVFP